VAWQAMTTVMVGVGDLVQKTEAVLSTGWVLVNRMIERSGDTECSLHRTQGDVERGFLGLASKPRAIVCQWFGLKTTRSGFPVWASKPAAMVS
jgi:hypothetical protein